MVLEYETLGWLKNGTDVYFVGERDGWAHLHGSFGGGSIRQITSGKFEVEAVTVSNDGSKFYLTTSRWSGGARTSGRRVWRVVHG